MLHKYPNVKSQRHRQDRPTDTVLPYNNTAHYGSDYNMMGHDGTAKACKKSPPEVWGGNI